MTYAANLYAYNRGRFWGLISTIWEAAAPLKLPRSSATEPIDSLLLVSHPLIALQRNLAAPANRIYKSNEMPVGLGHAIRRLLILVRTPACRRQ